MNTSIHGIALALSVALMATMGSGCTKFRIATPAGFAQLQHQAPTYDYRSVSAYGVALSVRIERNTERGNLAFWAEAIDRHLQQQGSYHANGSTEIHTASGMIGRRLAYTFGDAQSGSTYWVTVFVTTKRVFLLEAGGATDSFTRAQSNIEHAIQSFTG